MANKKGFKLPKTKEEALAMAKNLAGQTAASFDPLINYYQTESARIPGEQQIQDAVSGIYKGAFDTAGLTSADTFNNLASVMGALGGAGSNFGTFFSRIAGGESADVDPYKKALASDVLKYTMQGRKSAADQRAAFGEAAAKTKASKRSAAADFLSTYASLLSTLPSLGGGYSGSATSPVSTGNGRVDLSSVGGVVDVKKDGYWFASNPNANATSFVSNFAPTSGSVPTANLPYNRNVRGSRFIGK